MNSRTRVRVLAVASAIAGCALSVSGQTPDSTRAIAPRLIGVFDGRTGEPIPGVQVRDVFSGSYVLTTATGTARLSFLTFLGAAGFIELRKIGYEPKEILVDRADTVSITAIMDQVTTLAPVVTTESYRLDRDAGKWAGFEERCHTKSVTCFRNEDLEKRPAANIADFLIHAAGVTMGQCGGGSGRWNPGRNGQCGKIAMKPSVIPPAFCQPTFFVDGFEWDSHTGAPIDLVPGAPPNGAYTPANAKGIEVYPPGRTRPLRFQGGDPACGVVVIWTK